MEVPPEMIYAIVSALSGAICFMAMGFIYIFKEVKKKWLKAEDLLSKYIKAYAKLEANFKVLEERYETLISEHRELSLEMKQLKK